MRRSVRRTFVDGPSGRLELPLESLVTARRRSRWAHALETDHRAVVELARRPVSLVELGAALGVPVPVVRRLVRDLIRGGYVELHLPPRVFGDGSPGGRVLIRLLRGLRAR